jgi:hypothetical protein
VRVRQAMPTVDQLTEPFAWRPGSEEVDSAQSSALSEDALLAFRRKDVTLLSYRFRRIAIVDFDGGSPGVIGFSLCLPSDLQSELDLP